MFSQSSLKLFSRILRRCGMVFVVGISSLFLAGCFDLKGIINPAGTTPDVRLIKAAKQVRLDDEQMQEFGTKEHKFKVYPPPGFLFSEVDAPFGKVFSFTSNSRKVKDAKTAVITINIIVQKPGDPKVGPAGVLKILLTPFHDNCLDYFDERIEPFLLKGREFRATKFSGNYGGYYQIQGLAYCTAVEGGFVTVMVQDKDTLFAQTEKVFRSFFDSMEIEY